MNEHSLHALKLSLYNYSFETIFAELLQRSRHKEVFATEKREKYDRETPGLI